MNKYISITFISLLFSIISFAQNKDEAIININIDTLAFQQVAIGDSYEFEYTLSAENITENIEITVPFGYGFRLSANGYDYSYSYTLNHTNGTIEETTLWVKFSPVEEIDHYAIISHSSGELTATLPVSGVGIGVDEPYVITNPHEINFGEIKLGTDSLIDFWHHFHNIDQNQLVTIYYPLGGQGFTNYSGGSWIALLAGGMSGYHPVRFTPPGTGFFQGDISIAAYYGTTGTIHVTGYGVTEFNNILSFSATEQAGNALINYENKTIQIGTIAGTDLTNITPAITISNNATISPEIGTTQDFSESFEYTVTAQNGTEQIWTVNFTTPASINNIENQISIYPNPSNGIFTLDLQASVRPCSVLITDITGKIIYTAMGYVPLNINLSNQPAGIYFITITTEKGKLNKKIIIK